MSSKSLLSALLLAAACTPAGAPTSGPERDEAAEEIGSANMALIGALNAHDADSILSFYDSTASFTYLGCTSMLQGGHTFAGIVRGYHKMRPDVTWEVGISSLDVLDADVAVVSLQGESDSLQLFTTRVWKRGEDGRWRVAYEHESWPGCSPPRAPHPGINPGDSLSMDFPDPGA